MDTVYVSETLSFGEALDTMSSLVITQNILTATLKGLFDSIKGIAVIFYLDKEVNKRNEERQTRRATSMERSFNSETKATTRFGHRQNKDNKRDEWVTRWCDDRSLHWL